MNSFEQTTKDTDSTAGAFTPGPWAIVPYGDGDSLVIHSDHASRVCFLAMPGNLGSFDRIKANARLISAAPDLYEELNSLIAYAQSVASLCDVHYAHIDKALAALAKAEGR